MSEDATTRERNRLRDVLDAAHAALRDALNATPLDSPPGTASGFDHEARRRDGPPGLGSAIIQLSMVLMDTANLNGNIEIRLPPEALDFLSNGMRSGSGSPNITFYGPAGTVLVRSLCD